MLAALALAGSGVLPASTLSFSGNFTHDDDVVLIPFSISGSTLVTIQTTSFADGSTGFEPVLTLFDGLGTFMFQDAGGNAPLDCGARLIDPASGFCLDAYIQQTLGPGSYTLALSEAPNAPGGDLADGFPQAGMGDFTGLPFGKTGPFYLFEGSQRTSAWALQIDGAAVPEPGTMGLLGSCLLGTALLGLRLRR